MIIIAASGYRRAQAYAEEHDIPMYKWRFASDAGLLVSGVTQLIVMRCAYLHRNYKEIVVASDNGDFPIKWC